MPDTPALRIEIDTPQWRIDKQKDRLFTQITGKFVRDPHEGFKTDGWDMAASTGVWQEPITGKLLLNPLARTDAWRTTSTGFYARLQKANYTFADSTKWQDVNYSNAAGVAVEAKEGDYQNFAATTNGTPYDANTPFYFGPQFFAAGNDSRGYAECSFGGFDSGVDLRFYISGQAEIRKAGVLVHTANWSGNSEAGSPQSAKDQRVGFFILAVPPAQLIVVTTWGGGFSHIFDDLSPVVSGNAVLPSGQWSFRCNNMKASVEAAPLFFEASGTGYSIDSPLSSSPGGRTAVVSVIQAAPGFGDATYTAAYDGTRFSVAFTSGAIRRTSYFIGAIDAEYEPVLVETPDETLDITDWVKDCQLCAGMDPGSFELKLQIAPANLLNDGTLEEIDPDGTRDIYNRENRSFRVWLGDLLIMDGIAAAPELDDSTTKQSQRLHFTVKDKQWALMSDYRFTDPTAFDGYTVKEAWEKLIETAGNLPADLGEPEFEVDDEAAGVNMETSGGSSQGDWAYQVMPRDTAADAVLDIHQKYAADWFVGTRPRADGPIFQILSPSTLGENAELILYDSREGVDSDPEEQLYPLERVFRSYNDRKIPIEANQLHIFGLDYSTRRPIVVKWEDIDSQDPTKDNSDKPDNHIGTIRKAGLHAPALRTQDAVISCGEKLWRKLKFRRTIAEIDCEMLLHPVDQYPLWPGDCIELAGRGIFRIQGLSTSFLLEHVTTRYGQRRPTHYLLEKLEDVEDARGLGHTNQKGLTVADVLADSLERMKRGIFDVEEQLRPVWSRTDAP